MFIGVIYNLLTKESWYCYRFFESSDINRVAPLVKKVKITSSFFPLFWTTILELQEDNIAQLTDVEYKSIYQQCIDNCNNCKINQTELLQIESYLSSNLKIDLISKKFVSEVEDSPKKIDTPSTKNTRNSSDKKPKREVISAEVKVAELKKQLLFHIEPLYNQIKIKTKKTTLARSLKEIVDIMYERVRRNQKKTKGYSRPGGTSGLYSQDYEVVCKILNFNPAQELDKKDEAKISVKEVQIDSDKKSKTASVKKANEKKRSAITLSEKPDVKENTISKKSKISTRSSSVNQSSDLPLTDTSTAVVSSNLRVKNEASYKENRNPNIGVSVQPTNEKSQTAGMLQQSDLESFKIEIAKQMAHQFDTLMQTFPRQMVQLQEQQQQVVRSTSSSNKALTPVRSTTNTHRQMVNEVDTSPVNSAASESSINAIQKLLEEHTKKGIEIAHTSRQCAEAIFYGSRINQNKSNSTVTVTPVYDSNDNYTIPDDSSENSYTSPGYQQNLIKAQNANSYQAQLAAPAPVYVQQAVSPSLNQHQQHQRTVMISRPANQQYISNNQMMPVTQQYISNNQIMPARQQQTPRYQCINVPKRQVNTSYVTRSPLPIQSSNSNRQYLVASQNMQEEEYQIVEYVEQNQTDYSY
jgi:hypothetical protein